ncbi:hypothetical protein, partial [Caulobacter sp. 17J65-9]|uniref:hypothetical protein n=1 Tax=Caulobacter sp. 17J65-9 TaxID=2709382 RepID=UPI0013C97994
AVGEAAASTPAVIDPAPEPAAPAAPAETPLFSTGTETETPGEARPSKALVRTVIRRLDASDVEMLDECVAFHGLKAGDYAALLSAVRVKPAPGRELWFVRPALAPRCDALYGAHLFRYFLVERRAGGAMRVVFENGGDGFAVYPTVSHGLNDIETTGCTVGDCWIVRHAYDGKAYRPARCMHEIVGERTEPMNCEDLG